MKTFFTYIAYIILSVTACNVNAAVIWVAWDGADYRVAQQLVNDGLLPNLASINWGRMEITSITQTAPSWQEQVSGMPWYVNGCVENANCKPISPGYTIFDLANNNGKSTAAFFGKPWLPAILSVPTQTDLIADETLTIEDMGSACLEAAITHDFVFCHSRMPDKAGHTFGGLSENYRYKLVRLDVQLGRYILAGHTVLLTSDHGFEQELSDGYVEATYPARVFQYGFAHKNEPNAIIASKVPIRIYGSKPIDIFLTLCDLLDLPIPTWTVNGDGESLLIK